MNTFCTIGEAINDIKAQGANISAKELRRIARDSELPYRQGGGAHIALSFVGLDVRF